MSVPHHLGVQFRQSKFFRLQAKKSNRLGGANYSCSNVNCKTSRRLPVRPTCRKPAVSNIGTKPNEAIARRTRIDRVRFHDRSAAASCELHSSGDDFVSIACHLILLASSILGSDSASYRRCHKLWPDRIGDRLPQNLIDC